MPDNEYPLNVRNKTFWQTANTSAYVLAVFILQFGFGGGGTRAAKPHGVEVHFSRDFATRVRQHSRA